MSDAILKAENLVKYYPIRKGMLNKQVATKKVVDGIDLEIRKGQTLALVGESGCGKTVLLRTLIGLEKATDGKIYYKDKDITNATVQDLKEMRAGVQMIFQNSQAALHPRFTIQESLEEPLILSGMSNKHEREQRVVDTLYKVGLDASYCNRYPGSLSGGQMQRVAIARALVKTPELILADEPISALDVSLQAQVLNLLMDLKDELNLSMLFVAHDLAVVRQIADYTMIMYAGKIVEAAPAARIYDSAKHPYTKVLLKSAPSISKGVNGEDFHLDLKIGDAPDPANPPSGCLFHTRCIHATEECSKTCPHMEQVGEGHYVSCLKWKELEDK